MASVPQIFLLLSLLFSSIFLIKCNEDDDLFQEINDYRTSLNLDALTKNDGAECVAKQVADQFKDDPCTYYTDAYTLPGSEPQYANFPDYVNECNLDITTTREGQILPVCVPDLDPGLVISNFTETQYSYFITDSQYTGIGIASDNNWIVAILTTSTPDGNYGQDYSSDNGPPSLRPISHLLFLFVAFFVLL